MTFEPDTLIAIAFLAPVALFAVLNVVALRTRGYESARKPVAPDPVMVTKAGAHPVEAANDGQVREAA